MSSDKDAGAPASGESKKLSTDSAPKVPKVTVQVAGDVLIAHDILHPSNKDGKHVSYLPNQKIAVYRQRGGAWHFSAILRRLSQRPLVERSVADSNRNGDGKHEAETKRAAYHVAKRWHFEPEAEEDAPTRPNAPDPGTRSASTEEHYSAHTLWMPFLAKHDDKVRSVFRIAEYLGTVVPAAPVPKPGTPLDVGSPGVILVNDEGFAQEDSDPDTAGLANGAGTGASAQKQWLVLKSEWSRKEDRANGEGFSKAKEPVIGEKWVRRWAGYINPLNNGDRGGAAGASSATVPDGRLVAITSASALRGGSRRIGTRQSWTRTIREVLAAVLEVEGLRDCPFVIIVFGAGGALVLQRQAPKGRDRPEFDGVAVLNRGELEHKLDERHPGRVVGYGTCVAVHVVDQLARLLAASHGDDELPRTGEVACSTTLPAAPTSVAEALIEGARLGILAGRLLLRRGYLHKDNLPEDALGAEQAVVPGAPPDPEAAARPPERKTQEQKCEAERRLSAWTTKFVTVPRQKALDDLNPTTWAATWPELGKPEGCAAADAVELVPLCHMVLPQREDQTRELARHLVRDGFEKLGRSHPIPYARFGKLTEYDPEQIDVMCSLQKLLRDHKDGPGTRPLSLAVFGPPGAGKSFTVKAIADDLGWSESKRNILEFNLSQLPDPAALFDALHQVASAGVKEPPLVFFDEFDTSLAGARLGWLRYFLAPMQDGAFSVGTQTYQLGRPVLVFAGGTAASAKAFGHAPQMSDIDLRAAKLPDFLSRLRATLDIPSVNPTSGDGRGLHHLRRALIVRDQLDRLAPQLSPDDTLRISDGVLDGLLFAPSYLHGARSLEAILTNSTLIGAREFSPSLLPPRHLLELHTDGAAFMQLVDGRR
jgi:hypothetical protein